MRAIDLLRRILVLGLVFVLGFLGVLASVAAATRPESTAWMPILLGGAVYLLLGCLPPLRVSVLRLAVFGFFTSGALACWFASEPASASEPTERFNAFVPAMGAIGPALCAIVLALLWEERRAIPPATWFWLALAFGGGFAAVYYSSAQPALLAHPVFNSNFRLGSQAILARRLPHRREALAALFCLIAVAGWHAARAGKASRANRLVFGVGLPVALALFDGGRAAREFALPLSSTNAGFEAEVALAAVFVLEAWRALRAPKR